MPRSVSLLLSLHASGLFSICPHDSAYKLVGSMAYLCTEASFYFPPPCSSPSPSSRPARPPLLLLFLPSFFHPENMCRPPNPFGEYSVNLYKYTTPYVHT